MTAQRFLPGKFTCKLSAVSADKLILPVAAFSYDRRINDAVQLDRINKLLHTIIVDDLERVILEWHNVRNRYLHNIAFGFGTEHLVIRLHCKTDHCLNLAFYEFIGKGLIRLCDLA